MLVLVVICSSLPPVQSPTLEHPSSPAGPSLGPTPPRAAAQMELLVPVPWQSVSTHRTDGVSVGGDRLKLGQFRTGALHQRVAVSHRKQRTTLRGGR